MADDDTLLFKDELPEPSRSVAVNTSEQRDRWKILIVDDEADVHSVTTYMIKGMDYQGRGFEFFHAYSGHEAKHILSEHHDIAVILLDVVMETDDSGLQLVRYIREVLGNRTVRIVLRTANGRCNPVLMWRCTTGSLVPVVATASAGLVASTSYS